MDSPSPSTIEDNVRVPAFEASWTSIWRNWSDKKSNEKTKKFNNILDKFQGVTINFSPGLHGVTLHTRVHHNLQMYISARCQLVPWFTLTRKKSYNIATSCNSLVMIYFWKQALTQKQCIIGCVKIPLCTFLRHFATEWILIILVPT